jgi:hypothetical protein
MTKACAIERLLVLPCAVAQAELTLLALEEEKQAAAAALQQAEDDLILADGLTGKNAETRAAQLRAATVVERHALEEIGRRMARQKVSIHHLQAEHSSLRSIARILGGSGPEVLA